MGQSLQELAKNPLLVSIISLLAGIFLSYLITNIRNKSGVFGYTTFLNRIGLSADDSVFGKVQVTWQGHEVRNLYSYTIEVENSTSRDFDNVEFKIFAGEGTIILNEKTRIINTPYIIYWSDKFKEIMHVPEGGQATEQQHNEYNRSREYNVSVFNRYQKLVFTFLCTRPNDDEEPTLYISTPAKGVKLKKLQRPYVILSPIFGVPIPKALSRALFICVVVVILVGVFIENIWISSVLCMTIGLIGQIFGAMFFKVEMFIKKAISG